MWVSPPPWAMYPFECLLFVKIPYWIQSHQELMSASSDLVECADVVSGTPDCLSYFLQMAWIELTDRDAFCRAFSVRLGPIHLTIFFTCLTTCSLYKSLGMLLPAPPLVLTNLSQMSWWASIGDRRAFACNCSLSASRQYFVLPEALKWRSRIRQQRKICSPSPSPQASLNSRTRKPMTKMNLSSGWLL